MDFGFGDDESVITFVDGSGERVVIESFASVNTVDGPPYVTVDEWVRALDAFETGNDAVMRRVVREVEDRLRRVLFREGGSTMAPPGKPDRDE